MSEEATALLREIRDQQRQALERQTEAIALQREHMALYQKQLERAERIQDRAEAIQGRAGKALKFILWIAIPLVLVLFVLMFQPYVERLLS
jgi:hypothetical protein